MFLEAGGGVVGVEVAAGGPRVHALLQPLGLGVTLVTGPETCTHWLESNTVSPSELQSELHKIRSFIITKKVPSRAFTFKTH